MKENPETLRAMYPAVTGPLVKVVFIVVIIYPLIPPKIIVRAKTPNISDFLPRNTTLLKWLTELRPFFVLMEWDRILNELTFRTSRSSGAGGQHVNKTETKVELLFDINKSSGLTANEKEMIMERLQSQLIDDRFIRISSQRSRSQLSNKEDAVERLKIKLEKALKPRARRIRTKPSSGSIEERLLEKKRTSEIKSLRRKPPPPH